MVEHVEHGPVLGHVSARKAVTPRWLGPARASSSRSSEPRPMVLLPVCHHESHLGFGRAGLPVEASHGHQMCPSNVTTSANRSK